MNDQTPASPPSMGASGGWTIETYAAHNEALRQAQARFEAERDRRYTEINTLRERAAEVALEKATSALDTRLERMNEFRDQITNERAEYLRRDQYESDMRQVRGELRQIQDKNTKSDGRSLGILGIGLAAAGSLIISVLNFALRSI